MPSISPSPPAGLLTATTRLTSAQILALSGTHVAHIPAPGSGAAVVPLAYCASLHAGGVVYANVGVTLAYFAGANLITNGTTNMNGFLDSAVDAVLYDYLTAALGFASSVVAGLGLALGLTPGNPINGTGTLTVTTYYMSTPL